MFKVIDANNDKFTWWCNGVLGYGAMSHQTHATMASDDWLVTPPMHLTSDRVYTVAFKVRNIMDTHRNTLEVKWGKGNNPEQLTNTLIETFTPDFSETNGQWQVCTADIIPDANGNFYIGFHDNTSAKDKYQIAVDSITITKTAYAAAPDSVKSLTITPAQKGVLQATVSFITLSVIGVDRPHNPMGIVFTDEGTKLKAVWDTCRSTGANGGYFDPEGVSVTFFVLEKGEFGYELSDSVTATFQGEYEGRTVRQWLCFVVRQRTTSPCKFMK